MAGMSLILTESLENNTDGFDSPEDLLRAWMAVVCCQVAFQQLPETARKGMQSHGFRSVGQSAGFQGCVPSVP